jgi:DNA-binding LytR/AlgR family response regulator
MKLLAMKTNILIHLGSRKKISPANILMLKSDINYTLIYLDDGSRILSSTTMGKIEKRLKDFQFFRPNRSIIFNLEFMANYENKAQSGSYGKILLKNNEKIALSRRKSEAFFKIIQ